MNIGIYGSTDSNSFVFFDYLSLISTGSRLGPTGTDTLGPTGTFTLGGPSDGELKFYYDKTGGLSTMKTILHSIRHNEEGKAAEVSGFTSHYKLRSLR